MKTLTILLLVATALLAQQHSDDGDKLVTVQKRYVSAEGIQKATDEPISKWIGVGKEIGIATREGLMAVVDVSEKFGTTKVGHFVMFMVAWKIIGADILRVALGVPFIFACFCLWVWSMKRCFFGVKMLVKQDGKIKEYATVKPIEFDSHDAKSAAAVAHAAFALLLIICTFTLVI